LNNQPLANTKNKTGREDNSLREFNVKNPGLKAKSETNRIMTTGINEIAPNESLSKIPNKVVQIIAINIEIGI
jgi:hypothetical protein